jgi:Spy/CpxP family protein refolding chaperone
MNSKTRTLFALVATIAVAATAFAQGGRGPGGPGGQRGFQMGGMMNSESMLLMREDVQKDIKLTPEQKTKLEAIRTEMQEKMRGQFQFGRGGDRGGAGNGTGGTGTGGTGNGQAGVRGGDGGSFNMQEIQKQIEAMQKESNEKSKAVLTPEQWARLGQIKVQLGGPRLLIEDEMAKKLGLKAMQKLSITELLDKQSAANQQIGMKMREEGADREALMAEIRKNDEIMRAEVDKVLTDDQRKMLKELEGPKFVADPNSMNNMFGGGFGGRGGGGFGGRGGGGTGGGGGQRGGGTGGGGGF